MLTELLEIPADAAASRTDAPWDTSRSAIRTVDHGIAGLPTRHLHRSDVALTT
jgi:hypothetical protein